MFIEYPKDTTCTYQGRNGLGKMRGLNIIDNNQYITVIPENTKGWANCMIDIDRNSIQDLINTLQQFIK